EVAEEGEPVVHSEVDLARPGLVELRLDVGDELEDHPVEMGLVPAVPVPAIANQGDRPGRLVPLQNVGTGAVDDPVEGVGSPVRVGRPGTLAEVDGLRGL